VTGQLGPTRSDQMGWKQRPIASAGRANLAWIRIVQDRSILSRLSECRSDHSASYRPTASPINLDWTTHDSNPHFHLQKGLLASDPGDPICKVRGLSIAAIKIVTAQQPFSIVRARLHHCPVPSPHPWAQKPGKINDLTSGQSGRKASDPTPWPCEMPRVLLQPFPCRHRLVQGSKTPDCH